MSNANTDECALLGGKVKLIQFKTGLRAGLDAVMVAAAVPAQPGERVLDAGCGTGAAGLCVQARVENVRLTGIDIQADLIMLAARNVTLNGWQAEFLIGDVRDKTRLPYDHFEHSVCNPPYNEQGTWYDTPDPVRSKQLGHQGDARLMDWIDCLHRTLKPHGTLSLIHRADHADKIIQALGTRFGGLELWPLHPHEGEVASRLVIRALKNRKSPVKMYPGIVLHEVSGGWTQRVDDILAHGKPLEG